MYSIFIFVSLIRVQCSIQSNKISHYFKIKYLIKFEINLYLHKCFNNWHLLRVLILSITSKSIINTCVFKYYLKLDKFRKSYGKQ